MDKHTATVLEVAQRVGPIAHRMQTVTSTTGGQSVLMTLPGLAQGIHSARFQVALVVRMYPRKLNVIWKRCSLRPDTLWNQMVILRGDGSRDLLVTISEDSEHRLKYIELSKDWQT